MLRDPAPDAVREMEELLRSLASGISPNRHDAVTYTRCRAVLMESDLKELLPGFLLQCLSVFKFSDFIILYDPRPEARIAFLKTLFRELHRSLEANSLYDAFGEDSF